MLTRSEIIKVIQEGGSVIWNGSLITGSSGIPSEAELALVSNEKEVLAEAKVNLENEVARLQAELAKVRAAEKQSEKDEKKSQKSPKDSVEQGNSVSTPDAK